MLECKWIKYYLASYMPPLHRTATRLSTHIQLTYPPQLRQAHLIIRHHPNILRARLIPGGGPKRLAIRHHKRHRRAIVIQVVKRIGNVWVAIGRRVHEPLGRVDLLRQDQSEEDQQRADVQPGIQPSGRDVVVLCPPALELPLQEPVEENAHRAPA